MSIDAMKQALEALEKSVSTCFDRYSHEQVMSRPEHFINQTMTALRLAIEQAEKQEPAGSFMTRQQAIEFCRRRRPNIEPTEQQINATIDAYAALFGDLVPAPPQQEKQEPVAERFEAMHANGDVWITTIAAAQLARNAAPPQHQPLTETEIEQATGRLPIGEVVRFARAIERAHGIGGGE